MTSMFPTSATTFSSSISFLANAATSSGLIGSTWTMYLIGRPLMPPLSFTQLKYARTLSVISSQLTPTATVTIAPILIGLPFAFLPVPRPQTLFVGDAFPDPTGAAADDWTAPVAQAASSKATTLLAASATPAINLFDLI